MQAVALDVIQLHGSETPTQVARISAETGREVWKAIGVRRREDLAAAATYAGAADRVLYDAKPPEGAPLPGGTGLRIDWSLLRGADYLGMALMGNLWLCGQSPLRMPEEESMQKELPHYHPAAISAADTAEGERMVGLREVAIRYYAREHSLLGDLRLLLDLYWNRLLGSMTETASSPSVTEE